MERCGAVWQAFGQEVCKVEELEEVKLVVSAMLFKGASTRVGRAAGFHTTNALSPSRQCAGRE